MRTMSGGPCQYYDCANKTSFGYCRTTVCINPQYSNIGTAQYGQGVQKRIIINADRFRAMTDEEMAEWFAGHDAGLIANVLNNDYVEPTKDSWLEWLKEEREDN